MSATGGTESIVNLAAFDMRSVFFAGAGHDEALARLAYLAEHGQKCGIVTGPKGVGKSTLLRGFARDCVRAHCGLVLIDATALEPADLLRHLAEGLGIASHADDQINKLWTEVSDGLAGQRQTRRGSIIILDHLDQASTDCGPVVRRLLAQHASSGDVSLILGFSGGSYPVVANEWRQEADLRIELNPLTPDETAVFLRELLAARDLPTDSFEPAAAEVVFHLTGGMPRQIVRLFTHSLLAAMHDREPHVSSQVVEAAMRELRCLRPSA